MDISIIVPVFNAEKYLDRCISSILKSLERAEKEVSKGSSKARGKSGGSKKLRVEIIAVDNNSSDGSLAKLHALAKKHPSIRVLECRTPGAAAARNFGLREAGGEYFWFVDSDDEIRSDAVSKLLNAAYSSDADMVMLGMKRIYPSGETNYLSAVRPEEPNYKSRFIRYGLGTVQVLARRKWWEKNHFNFKEGVIQEDMELMSSLILHTDKYAAVDEPIYLYYQNSDSVLHKEEFSTHIFDIFPALEGLYQRFVEAKSEQEFHDELEWFFIWNLLIDSAKDFGQFPEGKPGFSRAREMLKEYFPAWRRNRFLREKPLKLRMRVRLNYYK